MIDLGHNVFADWYSCAAHGEQAGLLIGFHGPDFNGPNCVGSVRFCACGTGPRWTLEATDPITVAPSINCRGEHQHHGFIREGKWIPA